MQAAATDNGLNIALAEQHSFPLADVFHFLHAETVQPVLEQAALASPIFGTRWRWDANRALALLRFQGGKKVPPQIQRMRSDDLLASVFPDVAACQENIEGEIKIPDHPLVNEVMKDVLTEAMDIDGLQVTAARDCMTGDIRCLAVDTPVPSQFSHEILNANPYAYLDDAPLEERRARAVEMRRMLPEAVLEEVGRLDPAAIAQVREEAWPDVRDADELHDVLHTLDRAAGDLRGTAALGCPAQRSCAVLSGAWIALASNDSQARARSTGQPRAACSTAVRGVDEWHGISKDCAMQRRAIRAEHAGATYWVAAERAKNFRFSFPEREFDQPRGRCRSDSDSRPTTPADPGHRLDVASRARRRLRSLVNLLGLPASEIEKALLRMEAAAPFCAGNLPTTPRGRSRPRHTSRNEHEWCERRLLARIHRLTVATLRKQIEPVTAAQFMRWLLRWQHVAPGSQVRANAPRWMCCAVQGFEIPANAWERHILGRRISNYDPKWLDQLCLTGRSDGDGCRRIPRRWTITAAGQAACDSDQRGSDYVFRARRSRLDDSPSSTFCMTTAMSEPSRREGLAKSRARCLDFLRQRGASFFADIVRGTGRLKAEVETALWELVAAGLVTADGFDNLRSLIDPKRRAGQGSGRTARPRHSTGTMGVALHRPGGRPQRAVEATCWMLLRRYGIVFRDLLARETNLPKWRELQMAFRRLEDRGEIRGGRFVDGFLGEQFALPVAVESLRATRKMPKTGET